MEEALKGNPLNLFGTSFDRGGTRKGLMLAAMTRSADITNEVILKCQDRGLILFWLLEGCAIRITPPLTISEEEMKDAPL
jgi:4-aminobutyrate aminotransferase-like enzyme